MGFQTSMPHRFLPPACCPPKDFGVANEKKGPMKDVSNSINICLTKPIQVRWINDFWFWFLKFQTTTWNFWRFLCPSNDNRASADYVRHQRQWHRSSLPGIFQFQHQTGNTFVQAWTIKWFNLFVLYIVFLSVWKTTMTVPSAAKSPRHSASTLAGCASRCSIPDVWRKVAVTARRN